MNYIKLYIGDYMKKTGTLSVAEHGAYVLMLLHYYATEAPLPTGRDLYRLLRAETKQDREAVESIAAKYWQQTEGGLVNERADEEIQKAAKAKEAHSEAGKQGGRPKRKQTETNLVSETEPNEKPTNTNTNTITTSLRSVERARGTRLPADWVPESWPGPDDDPRTVLTLELQELPKFRDYWISQPGQKGVKADWNATWRNWIRKAVEYAESRGYSRQGPAKPTSAVERVREACNLDADGFPLGPDDGDLRPQVDEQLRHEAGGNVVEAPFRVVS